MHAFWHNGNKALFVYDNHAIKYNNGARIWLIVYVEDNDTKEQYLYCIENFLVF